MAGLTLLQLLKRNNLKIFKSKIEAGIDFPSSNKVSNHTKYTISPELNLLEALSLASEDKEQALLHLSAFVKNKALYVKIKDSEKEIPTGYLLKTKDFGSRYSEDIYIQENREFNNFNSLLRKITIFGLRPVNLIFNTIGNRTVEIKNIKGIQIPNNPKGNPAKADFELIDPLNTVVAKISHKHGNKATHFRQWSGIKHFQKHPEVLYFENKLKERLEGLAEYPSSLTYGYEIKDEKLKKESMFGFGDMIVDFVIQGRISISLQEKNTYIVTSNLVLSKEDDISCLPDDYQPVLLTKKRHDRAAFGIKGCRALIYPKKGRKIHDFIT